MEKMCFISAFDDLSENLQGSSDIVYWEYFLNESVLVWFHM